MASIITTPFTSESFAEEMKPKISGVDLVLEYANIESSVSKVAIDCMYILSETLYEEICEGNASSDTVLQAKALDLLQRAMLHFCLYEHLIFLITRIKNDGVTIVKSDKETTVFKSQQDGLETKLISLGWFWMNRLIQLLNKNAEQFPDWENSDAQKETESIPIGLSDFDRWVGIKDEYFMIVSRWLIREVWGDCVLSRVAEPTKTDDIARAVCYEVLGRACTRLSYFTLPEPIRLDVNNEMGKNHNAQEDKHIREVVAGSYLSKSQAYWTRWEVELKKQAVSEGTKQASDRPTFTAPRISENDSFAF